MPRRSSLSRYDDYEDSKKYDDPWMGYSDDFEDPYRHSERTTSRYDDPYSSHAFDNSSSMDQDAYPPRSFETPYSSIRDDPPSSSSRRSHRSSSRRPESSSRYESSSYSSPFDPYSTSSSRSNTHYAGGYLSSRYDEPSSSRYDRSTSSRYDEPTSSRYESSPYSSRRDSTLDSSSGYDLQSTFTRSVLGRDAPSKPSRSSFTYTTPDNSDLYPSSPGRYSSGPTSDPYSHEKYASSKYEPSKRSRRYGSSRRYDYDFD
ncbi:MAG: hypothetical protein LQ347_003366 [Umbilicaria vellea]|nr:MAG: hypothetical protein LQ347_003366 [Umbilicaria vellea]